MAKPKRKDIKMIIEELKVVDEDNIGDMNICYNCEHATESGGLKVICMGSTPWKGEQLNFNNSCSQFTE